jgi:hypothetical protein
MNNELVLGSIAHLYYLFLNLMDSLEDIAT